LISAYVDPTIELNRAISINFKMRGGYRQMFGGVNMHKKKIYIKKILTNIKITLSWWWGGCHLSTGGGEGVSSLGGVKISVELKDEKIDV